VLEDQFTSTLRRQAVGASVHPREIVRLTLLHGAASVIVAHNHPSEVAEPSQADEGVTRRFRQALALIDVRLLDHLIVGDGRYFRFRSTGCYSRIEPSNPMQLSGLVTLAE
jgi:DNA repair protein RadC